MSQDTCLISSLSKMNSDVLVILLEDLALNCRLVNHVEQDIVSLSFSDDLVITLLATLEREKEKH